MAPLKLPTGRTVDPTQYKYYNESFYNKKNPYDDFNQDMDAYAKGAYDKYGSLLSQAPWQGGGSGGFKWGAVNPSDPRIGTMMSNLRGGQQTMLNQYTNQAANAGIERGGYGVSGGNRQAALSQQAIKELASQYSGDYWKSLGLLDEGEGRMASLYGTALSGAANLAGDYAKTRLGGVQGGADWASKLLSMQREDYGKDIGAQQGWETQVPQMEEHYLQLAQQQQEQYRKQQQDDAMNVAREYIARHPVGNINDPTYMYYWQLLKNNQDIGKGSFGRY